MHRIVDKGGGARASNAPPLATPLVCMVLPWMLKVASPVGAVSNTTTSSGSTCPERRNSFTVSLHQSEMT